MFSSTIKRSVATLGVVAVLLAVAGPASAMPIYMKYDDLAVKAPGRDLAHKEGAANAVLDTGMFEHEWLKAPTNAGPQPEVNGYLASDPSSEVDNQIRGDAQDTQTSRASSLQNTMVSGYDPKAAAEGTQVGSEGVKAATDKSTEADNQLKYHLEDVIGVVGVRENGSQGAVKAPGPCANVPAQLSVGGAEAAGFVNGCAPGYVPVRQVGSEVWGPSSTSPAGA
jgi:hypothetical protein